MWLHIIYIYIHFMYIILSQFCVCTTITESSNNNNNDDNNDNNTYNLLIYIILHNLNRMT